MASERPIATFQYEDLKDGVGSQTLYGYATEDSTGTYSYYISPFQTYSRTIDHDELTLQTGDHTFTFYSGTFNRPRTLYGDFHVMFCWSANAGITVTPQVKVYHYDGSTSTQLGSTWTGDEESGNATAADGTYIENAIIDVTASGGKRFKQGDSIKVEIILDRSANGTQVWLGCDPMNRDGTRIAPSTNTGATTQIIMRPPFKVDY